VATASLAATDTMENVAPSLNGRGQDSVAPLKPRLGRKRLLACARFVESGDHVHGTELLTAVHRPSRPRARRPSARPGVSAVVLIILVLGLAGCGAAGSAAGGTPGPAATAHPQVIEPIAGVQPTRTAPANRYGDPTAHATPLAQVRAQLKLEIVAERVTNARYIDPLQYVTLWERTDQGVDANMPVGAPILAPCPVKILAVIPDWYAGQPLVYFELLNGPDAGKVQYVAEEITSIAPPDTILSQGQAIARYAARGTGIEYGWSTPNGVTLAVATTGYEEGQVTPAGRSIRQWLNSLGANAGNA
jgi:hypothetical protein